MNLSAGKYQSQNKLSRHNSQRSHIERVYRHRACSGCVDNEAVPVHTLDGGLICIERVSYCNELVLRTELVNHHIARDRESLTENRRYLYNE